MGDEGQSGKSAGVPAWQLKKSEKPEETQNSGSETPAQETSSRASIVEDARKFLQNDEVRNSSTDKQIAFLEEKGLEAHEIESLLGVRRNSEATNTQDVSHPILSNPAFTDISVYNTLSGSSRTSFSTDPITSSFKTCFPTKYGSRRSTYNNIPGIPHHSRPSTTPRNCTSSPHYALLLRWHLCPPLRNQQLPCRANGRLPHRVSPQSRRNSTIQHRQTNIPTQ